MISAYSQARRSILVVDENSRDRQLVQTLLSQWGFEVQSTQHVAPLLNPTKERPIDLILVSLVGAENWGIKICRRLRALYKNAIILVLTAPGDAAMQQQSLKAGSDGFLNKPIVDVELLGRIHALFRDRRKTQQCLDIDESDRNASLTLLKAITQAQEAFVTGVDSRDVFAMLLQQLLLTTASEYGFLGEVFHDEAGARYLKHHAICNFAWNDDTRLLAQGRPINDLVFDNLDSLYGKVIRSGLPVISNDPGNDPRSAGLPRGHPDLDSFLGMPLIKGHEVIGMFGLANRAGGYDRSVIENISPLLSTCVSLMQAKRAEDRRREADLRLRENEQQLETWRNMEAVGELAGGIAHDLNNVLTTISGFARLVADELSPGDPHRDDLQEVLRSADSAARLTEQLMTISKQRRSNPVVADLNATVVKNDKVVRQVLGTGIQLVKQLTDDQINVLIDPGQLDQVLLNLTLNARDSMRDGGSLTITTAIRSPRTNGTDRPGKIAELTFRDTGIGIPESNLETIFEPYFTTKDSGQGTGLGLATSSAIINQFGGKIEVESDPGQGTTFAIRLPLCTTRPSAQAVPPPRESDSRRSGGKVLVVEDDSTILRIIVRALEQRGFNVLAAETGEQAIALAGRHESIDLLVADVVLPGLTGVELASQLRVSHPGIQIVLTSGHPENVRRPVVLADEHTEFLPKPFSPDDLMVKVNRLF